MSTALSWWRYLDGAITGAQRRSRALREHADAVARGGHSTHSGRGHTLPYMIAELEKRGVPYRIDARPGRGYVLTGLPEATQSREGPRWEAIGRCTRCRGDTDRCDGLGACHY